VPLKQFVVFSACSSVCAIVSFRHQGNASSNFFRCLRQMSVVDQRSIQGDTKIFRVLNVLNLRGCKLYLQCSVCVMCILRWKTHDSVLLGFGCNRHRWKYWFKLSRSTSRFASQSENYSCWYVSAISSAYWNLFDNVDGITDKYMLNNNGAKTLP
jgi:hypothetical protein